MAKGEIIRGVPGTQYAFFIGSANQNRYGIMRELAIYSGGNGFPKGRFRLHIYEANNAHSAPGGELLNEDIVLLPRPCEGWDNWDLSTFNIPVSEIGYFIAVEFVTQDEQFDYLFADYYPLYQVMRPPVKAKEQSIWNYSRTEGWKELPPTGNISYQYNTMLKVFVERAR